MNKSVGNLPLISRLRDRLDEHRRRLDGQHDRLDQHEARLDRQLARLDGFQARLNEWSLASARSRVEYTTAAHQIAAFEKRLAELEAAYSDRIDAGDDTARAEARDIVEAVQIEHARVRARLTMMGALDERLRRVESALLHAIKLEELPTPPTHAVGADVVEAREAGLIAPDATELPAPAGQREPLAAVPSTDVASFERARHTTPTQRTA